MRSAFFSLFSRNEGEGSLLLDKKAICASIIFLQQWYWQPLLYFISNCIEQKNPVDGGLHWYVGYWTPLMTAATLESLGVGAASMMMIGDLEQTAPTAFEFVPSSY